MSTIGDVLTQLEAIISERRSHSPDSSYVAKLNDKGLDTILKKIGEEATEVVIAAKSHEHADSRSDIVYESCDLLFHLMVLLEREGIQMQEIGVELKRRFDISGITEKESRNAS